jgi:hypothetical protein
MVTQDTALLHRSIAENILYGRPEASRDEMILAARQAHVEEFVSDLVDPDGRIGYDTMVGERGVKLSGGQRQRIAIARVLLKNAPILVLDEATSALDSEVEAAIQESFQTLMRGKTVIAIAHRLSTIAAMDRLIVLEAGRIIEMGSHRELLAREGVYAALWRRQSGGFLAAAEGSRRRRRGEGPCQARPASRRRGCFDGRANVFGASCANFWPGQIPGGWFPPTSWSLMRIASGTISGAGRPILLRLASACRRLFSTCRRSALQRPGTFRSPCRNIVHQPRRETIIGFELQFSQPPPNAVHAAGIDARLDHRRDECRKARGRPTGFLEPLGMDEIQPLERMLAFDRAVHMNAAFDTSVSLNQRARVDDFELVAVFKNFDVFVRSDGDDRQDSAIRLPAFGATASMIVGDLSFDAHLHGPALTEADEHASREARICRFHASVNLWVKFHSLWHGFLLDVG